MIIILVTILFLLVFVVSKEEGTAMEHKKVVDVQIMGAEERWANILINYTKTYSDGKKEACRSNVKSLDGYDPCQATGPIQSAECIGQVYCGALRNDVRFLFLAKKADGAVQLIQERAGSDDCRKLFELA